MQHLGYPSYFLIIKGICTLLAALVFVLPGMRLLKEWAYFGTFLIYIAAIASHLAVGDGFQALIAPIIFLSITITFSFINHSFNFLSTLCQQNNHSILFSIKVLYNSKMNFSYCLYISLMFIYYLHYYFISCFNLSKSIDY